MTNRVCRWGLIGVTWNHEPNTDGQGLGCLSDTSASFQAATVEKADAPEDAIAELDFKNAEVGDTFEFALDAHGNRRGLIVAMASFLAPKPFP